MAAPKSRQITSLRMRHGTHGRCARAFFREFYWLANGLLLFDVEAIFLYPWAYIYKDMFKISYSFGVYGFERCWFTLPSC